MNTLLQDIVDRLSTNEAYLVLSLVAIVYAALNIFVTFGSGRPLAEWINPGRRNLLWLAGLLAVTAAGYARWAVVRHQQPLLTLLGKLVDRHQEKAPMEIIVALFFATLAAILLTLFLYCWWLLPRDPKSFRRDARHPEREYGKALRHYVRWHGGLDYAAVFRAQAGELAPVVDWGTKTDIERGMRRLPELVQPPTGQLVRDFKSQIALWTDVARSLYSHRADADAVAAKAGQGQTVAVSLNFKYGAVYLCVLDEPTPAGDGGLIVLAASLNQHEVGTLRAGAHLALLLRAIEHIHKGVAA